MFTMSSGGDYVDTYSTHDLEESLIFLDILRAETSSEFLTGNHGAMTPSSQQTAAIFLLHARSFLKYFSRQQGGTKRKTVEENSEDLLTMMNEIR